MTLTDKEIIELVSPYETVLKIKRGIKGHPNSAVVITSKDIGRAGFLLYDIRTKESVQKTLRSLYER